MALNSRVCAGIKGKQEKNAAIPHGINADAKVLASIRWAHEYQVLAVCLPEFLGGNCLPEFLGGKRITEYSLKAWQLRVPNQKTRKDFRYF